MVTLTDTIPSLTSKANLQISITLSITKTYYKLQSKSKYNSINLNDNEILME